MAARMEIITVAGSMLHAAKIICHGFSGKVPQVGVRRAGVKGIGGVSQNFVDFVFPGLGKKGFYVRRF